MTGSGSQPYTTWDMVTLSVTTDTYYHIKTVFPGSMNHYTSSNIRMYVTCHPSSYTISEGTYYNSLTSTQYVAHGSSTDTGFYLPPYTSSQ